MWSLPCVESSDDRCAKKNHPYAEKPARLNTCNVRLAVDQNLDAAVSRDLEVLRQTVLWSRADPPDQHRWLGILVSECLFQVRMTDIDAADKAHSLI